MGDMVEFTINLGRNQGVGSIKIHNFTKEFKPNLIRGFHTSGVILKRQIQDHLTGPSATIDKSRKTPGSVTGYLREKITFHVSSVPVLRVGTNVVYAAIQEFGGRITQIVTAKQRKFFIAAKGIFLKIGQEIHIDIPARPYIGTAWEKKKHKVVEAIQKSISEPLK